MTINKNADIDFVEILSDIAMILDTSMVIRSNHDNQDLANRLVEFSQELSNRIASLEDLNHG